jgi:hypothetical protein
MMDIRNREAALKRRNDELDACQTLYGQDDQVPSYIQDQDFETPLLSRQESAQNVEKSNARMEQKEKTENTFLVSYHSRILQTPYLIILFIYNYIKTTPTE